MFTYTYDAAENTISTSASGVIKTQDVLDLFERYLEDDAIRNGAIENVSLIGAQDLQLFFTDIMRIRTKFKKVVDEKAISHTTLHVETDVEYGIARMVQTLFEEIDHRIEIERS